MEIRLRTFFEEVRHYIAHQDFMSAEVDYKLSLEGELRQAVEAYRTNRRNAYSELVTALRSPNQNIINWRVSQPFDAWCRENPRAAREALRLLWFGQGSVKGRFNRFAQALASGGVTQRGAQLCIGSTFLMGLGAREYPPIRTQVLNAGFKKTGYPPFTRELNAAECYTHAIDFLDLIVREAPTHKVTLESRLEAQGVIWCVSGGWRDKEPINEDRTDSENDDTYRLIDLDPSSKLLTATEKQALVSSRRGQGRFRQNLIALWGRCALTGCRDHSLLRASHLKPWKKSSNSERLDPYNGLLLAPHLDAALDCGLITFNDTGRLITSSKMSTSDRKALSITGEMRLVNLHERHLPYIEFHRKNEFRK